jgi:hypothetical protein
MRPDEMKDRGHSIGGKANVVVTFKGIVLFFMLPGLHWSISGWDRGTAQGGTLDFCFGGNRIKLEREGMSV